MGRVRSGSLYLLDARGGNLSFTLCHGYWHRLWLVSPVAQGALLHWTLQSLRSPLWRVQVPLARSVEQPWSHSVSRCGSHEAWDYFYRHQERMDLLLVAYTNFTTAPNLVPQELYGLQLRCSGAQRVTLGNWALEKSSINGAPGSTASAAEGCWQSSWSRVLTHELATLASVGAKRIPCPPGTLRLAGEPSSRHFAAWYCLHWLRWSCQARLLGMLRGIM